MHASYGDAFWFLCPNLNSTEPQTRGTYLYLSIFTFEETLPINPEIVCGVQKQGKRFFGKALIYLMMMMMMTTTTTTTTTMMMMMMMITYITFKGDFQEILIVFWLYSMQLKLLPIQMYQKCSLPVLICRHIWYQEKWTKTRLSLKATWVKF